MKKLLEIVEKYNLQEIKTKIEKIDKETPNVNIAFLGEFSSGKSSLINLLLNKKILPTMDKPTSKRIIEIEAKNVEKIIPYQIIDNEKKVINMLDFDELSVSSGDEKIYLEVPMNDFFKENYLIIDTPGISSIDKTDTDITFGYLPYLDGAIICQDIQKGTLPDSLLNFLLKPEIKPIIDNFIFAITKSDLKSPEAQLKIKNDVIKQLETLKQKYNLNLNDIDKKVILTSINSDLKDLKNSFEINIINKKAIILQQKKQKEINKIIGKTIHLLNEYKNNTGLDTSELEEKSKVIQNEINTLKSQKSNIEKKLHKLSNNLNTKLQNEFHNFITQVKSIKSPDEVNILEENLQNNIENIISSSVNTTFDEEINFNYSIIDFTHTFKDIIKYTEYAKLVSTMIITDILLPGSGVMSVVEGAEGALVRTIIQDSAKNSNSSSVIGNIAKIINQINPVEIVGDVIKNQIIESQKTNIPKIANHLTFIIVNEVKNNIEDIFDDISLQINSKKELFQNLIENKEKAIEDFSSTLQNIDNDIMELQKEKKNV